MHGGSLHGQRDLLNKADMVNKITVTQCLLLFLQNPSLSPFTPPFPPPQHLYLTFDPQSTRLFGRRTCTSYIFTERGSCAPQCVLNCCVGIQRRQVNDRERVILFMRAELQVRPDSRPAALCDSFTPHFLPLLPVPLRCSSFQLPLPWTCAARPSQCLR